MRPSAAKKQLAEQRVSKSILLIAILHTVIWSVGIYSEPVTEYFHREHANLSTIHLRSSVPSYGEEHLSLFYLYLQFQRVSRELLHQQQPNSLQLLLSVSPPDSAPQQLASSARVQTLSVFVPSAGGDSEAATATAPSALLAF